MYKGKIIKENGFSFIELQNTSKTTKAKICLEEGARLKELKFKQVFLIKEQPNFDYKDSYASSILFPFASRIQEGRYTFKDKMYQFNCNDADKNALHGLVYNKKFKVVHISEGSKFCSVILEYKEVQESPGFPYTYKIQLTYTLFEKEMSLSVKIENTDVKAFPFTVGWHPYFLSDNLSNSTLKFKSDKKIEFDENLITKRVVDFKGEEEFKIEDKQLDDCYILNSDSIEFKTPKYQIEITTNQIENYLQLYTPKDLPMIAIEPMTGISNSFNNQIGLQVLEPKQSYSFLWDLKLNNN
ncbi:aldose 1-epimerase [Polaribacter litorisediminis]|uniref:aldose 1-epimerase n=1 Tax=Polaribacter litorisediminis TaxID=1908341 RepID=UPI001CBE072B|nr:aldose 1-epimerase [Polaribacter litorisediminis]UAM98325.1 aldose 1-epimerase [Polaribacter litorisediminis]